MDIIENYDRIEERLSHFRESLINTRPEELHGIDDHISFLCQLRDFRKIIAGIDKLKGERYIEFINGVLEVGTSGIYDNEMRFLFELIQNVDDCDYHSNAIPTLSIQFDTNQGKIILRYNEIGFSPYNVFSITEIAGMSKNVSSDKIEIGEKGIGFKSVFGIAEKVLIQSGLFSFELHKNNPTIPIPYYNEDYSGVEGTKMTLFIEPKKCKTIYYDIVSEYKNKDVLFQNNPILFLNKLSSVKFFVDEFRTLSFEISNKQKYTSFTFEENVFLKISVKDYKDGIETNEKHHLNCMRFSQPIIFNREMCQSRYGKSTEFVKKTLLIQAVIPAIEDLEKIRKGKLYSYFPTQVETTVPIAIHVPFKLIDSREYVDDQNGNEWFKHCCQSLSDFLKQIYLHISTILREKIVYVLPNASGFVFLSNSKKSKGDNLRIPELSGITFCNLPIFWASGTLRSRKDIYCLKETENILEPESIHKLINNNKYLFCIPNGYKAESYGIFVESNVYYRLFEKAIREGKDTDEVLEVIDRANIAYSFLVNQLKNPCINYFSLKYIASHKKCLDAFWKAAKNEIKKDGITKVQFNKEIEWKKVRFGNPNTWTYNQSLIKYLRTISMHAVFADLGKGKFLPTKDGLVLDQESPPRSFANFCNEIDHENLFTARWNMESASRKLEKADNSLTVEEYMQLLVGVRESIKSSLGKSYQGYIKAIANAGTKPDRFLLELLQNADDLMYDDSCIPTFRLYSHGNTLKTNTNEKGFTKADARSITSIGESTKNKLIEGKEKQIGEKGIGFKSVFSIAKKVYIRSGEFSFSLSDQSPTVLELCDNDDSVSGTEMEFELKKTIDSSTFSDINLLQVCLFLRTLKRIEINGSVLEITDTYNNRIIYFNGTKYQFRKISKAFQIENTELLKERFGSNYNPKLIDQEIVFLIPDNPNKFPERFLYNGLPTTIKVGVPICINAPFQLDSSRESVIHNSWNSLVRTELYLMYAEMLEEIKSEHGIHLLNYIRYVYVPKAAPELFIKSDWLNQYNVTSLLHSKSIIATCDASYYARPIESQLKIYPDIIHKMDSVCKTGKTSVAFIEGKEESKRSEAILKVLGCKMATYSDTLKLITAYADLFMEDDSFRDQLYDYLSEVNISSSTIKNYLLSAKIIPVKPRDKNGSTYYICWAGNKIFVESTALFSTKEYWVLVTKILSKNQAERIFHTDISIMDDAHKKEQFINKLYAFLADIQYSDAQKYQFFIYSFQKENRMMKMCKDFMIANRDRIPLKTEAGAFRKGNVFISSIPEYFAGPLLRSHIASKECKEFAKMLQCKNISEIGPNNLDNVTLIAEDIEDLHDDDIIFGNTIIQHFLDTGKIPQNLIEEYELTGFKKSSYSNYSEEDFPNEPIRNYSSLKQSVSRLCANPRKIIKATVSRQVDKVVIPGEGEQLVDSGTIRSYTLQRYTVSDNTNACFCQMCLSVKDRDYIEVNNIVKNPKYYWRQLRISLCLECSKKFEFLRASDIYQKRFITALKN